MRKNLFFVLVVLYGMVISISACGRLGTDIETLKENAFKTLPVSGGGQFPNEAISILRSWGYTGTFYTPDRGTFDRYIHDTDNYGDEYLVIIWNNCTISDFHAYEDKWGAHRNYSITQIRYIYWDGGHSNFELNNIWVMVSFTSEGGEDNNLNFTVSPNSIVFLAYND